MPVDAGETFNLEHMMRGNATPVAQGLNAKAEMLGQLRHTARRGKGFRHNWIGWRSSKGNARHGLNLAGPNGAVNLAVSLYA
jgi:hypothetical protein